MTGCVDSISQTTGQPARVRPVLRAAMRIAIVHYHLSPGGVTTVIRAASHGLSAMGIRHVILCGAAAAGELPVRIVPDLRYLAETSRTAASLLEEMRAAAAEALGEPPDAWHFHNHSLGKNVLLPGVVSLLAAAGERLLLQLHDLAEDGRPENHAAIPVQAMPYPVADRIRYAFLNEGDRSRFISAGLPETHTILLPNPIPVTDCPPTPSGSAPLVLYPTRAIRRKNLGELLLLAMCAPGGARFAVTRAPENRTARAIHDHWKWTTEELDLPIDFDVVDRLPAPGGDGSGYEPWIAASTHFITTSVAEGFGMIFPEAAALGKPLIGRELSVHPRPQGGSLYREILIREEWLPAGELSRHLSRHLEETHRLYRRALPPGAVDAAHDALRHDGWLDFGNLPESLQREILMRIRLGEIPLPVIAGKPADEWLRSALQEPARPYSGHGLPENDYGKTLARHYQALLDQPAGTPGHVEPGRVLDAYLSPADFHFLLGSPQKIRAVIFDVYGTLLIAPPGGVKHDPAFDPVLREILAGYGHDIGESPTGVLHEAVRRHHALSGLAHPEIDLLEIWRETLGTTDDPSELMAAVERAWHPCQPMPRAGETMARLHGEGVLLGLLSNAQANTLPALDEALGAVTGMLEPELTILSYQYGMAKPSPELFELLARRLAGFGILPGETLFVGNDPLQDIAPAERAGFRTALFTGHPDSLRPGECHADLRLRSLSEIPAATSSF